MTQNSSQITTPNSSCNSGSVRVPRNLEISIPSPDSDRVMAIRCTDWIRLERSLTDASAPPKEYSALYGVLFGFSGSAFLSVIPLTITKDLPPWVLSSTIALVVASLFCGIFVVIISRDQQIIRKTMMTALLEDVKEIGNRYNRESTEGEQIMNSAVYELPDRRE